MSKASTLDGVRACFVEALRLSEADAARIDARVSAADLAAWDSLGHVRLILALEKRFGVQFADESVVNLVSVDAILAFLDGKNER
jgi:acyl carrier protein